jgi:hypothetical protein
MERLFKKIITTMQYCSQYSFVIPLFSAKSLLLQNTPLISQVVLFFIHQKTNCNETACRPRCVFLHFFTEC